MLFDSGPGPDFLAGQLGNDTLVGVQGTDTCHQGPGTGPRLTCEIPRDRDGDGIFDRSDACPDRGDRGYGVDARGCPIYADFRTACEEWGGTYTAGPVQRNPSGVGGTTVAPVCDWASTDVATWENASAALKDLCSRAPVNFFNLQTGAGNIGCAVPT